MIMPAVEPRKSGGSNGRLRAVWLIPAGFFAIVPLQAVRSDKPQPYIQVVENQQVRHVSVTLGARGQAGGQDMVAISGLPAGSLVLASTVGPLQEGTTVRTTPAAAAVQGR